MSTQIDHNYVSNFFEENTLGILSTIDENGELHAAPIFFVSDKKLNIYFVTPTHSQKNQNIKNNGKFVLTIANEKKHESAQIHGKITEDESPLAEVLTKLANKINQDDQLITTLPVIKHIDKKTVMIIRPTSIEFKKYTETELIEKTFNF